jgi:hypothetical protein
LVSSNCFLVYFKIHISFTLLAMWAKTRLICLRQKSIWQIAVWKVNTIYKSIYRLHWKWEKKYSKYSFIFKLSIIIYRLHIEVQWTFSWWQDYWHDNFKSNTCSYLVCHTENKIKHVLWIIFLLSFVF